MGLTGALVATVIAGCAGEDTGQRSVEVAERASSGGTHETTVVESSSPAWGSGEGWAVADTPSLVIGDADRPGHTLSRVAGAARLHDSRIVVANGHPPELRFFGPDGELIRRAGGEGEGPGEFRSLTGLHRAAPDSLLALDSDLHRLSVFDASGGYDGSVRLSGGTSAAGRSIRYFGIVGTVPGRGYLLDPGYPGQFRDEGVVYFDSVPARVVAPDGSLAGAMGSFRMEMYNPPRVQGSSVPFGRVTRAAAGPDGVWRGDGSAAEATLWSPEGEPVRVLRWGHERPELTEERIDALIRRRTEGASTEERRRLRRELEQEPLPDRVPAYSQLVLDAGGRLWAQRYRTRSYRGATRWDVLDPEDGWLGTVRASRHLDVQAIGGEWVLALWRDELDVEHVGLFDLRRD